ncbi:MAG: calcium/sodium antiporter [Candidatus Cloacimonadaceae bacterium]|nr:calcium/sodium antiporter [Candidatus Cloacimonadaceae bacterium]
MLYLIVGLVFLIVGANWLVKGASSLAKRFDIPQIVIGLTVVAFGTSAPELVVNVISSLKGASDIAFGNVIGSNNFNIFIILGISSLIYPLEVKVATTWKEIPFVLFISVLALLLVNDNWFNPTAVNMMSRFDGLILLAVFGLFLAYNWRLSKSGTVEGANIKLYSMFWTLAGIIAGMTGLIIGGEVIVKQALFIANEFGISEKVIALTIVAAGTSLPELATSAVAAYKKHPDIAVGNIVGSNVFNLLLVLGVSSMIDPPLYKSSFNMDFSLMILAGLLLFLFMFIPSKHCLDRREGGLLLAVYVAYAVFLLK